MYKRTENNVLGQSGIEMKKRVEVEGRVRHKRGSDSVRKCTLGRETDTQVALCLSICLRSLLEYRFSL